MTEPTVRMGDAAAMAGGYPGMTVDPDEVAPVTVMDDLRAALSEKVEYEIIETVVPARAKVMMLYKAHIDFDDLKAWGKKAKESRQKDAPVDMKKLAIIILMNTCVGMKFNVGSEDKPIWREMVGEHDGKPMTFSHRETQEMLGATLGGTYQAVEKMYAGYDGHIMLVSQTIMAKSGYAEYDFEGEDNSPLDG